MPFAVVRGECCRRALAALAASGGAPVRRRRNAASAREEKHPPPFPLLRVRASLNINRAGRLPHTAPAATQLALASPSGPVPPRWAAAPPLSRAVSNRPMGPAVAHAPARAKAPYRTCPVLDGFAPRLKTGAARQPAAPVAAAMPILPARQGPPGPSCS
jgi:hypothetical protein